MNRGVCGQCGRRDVPLLSVCHPNLCFQCDKDEHGSMEKVRIWSYIDLKGEKRFLCVNDCLERGPPYSLFIEGEGRTQLEAFGSCLEKLNMKGEIS